MFEFHKDKEQYFKIQHINAKASVLPFIESIMPIQEGMKVLEIGCAEAGVLKAFLEKGAFCTGIELAPDRVELAKSFHAEAVEKGSIRFITRDIYDIDPKKNTIGQFDLIVLKDVIEHIPNQERLIPELKKFLKPEGLIYFGFPAWRMPFGGHQQICRSKLLSKTPYFHLLPRFLYKAILKLFKEPQRVIDELLLIKSTRISTGRFEKIVRKSNLAVRKRFFYFIAPIYQYKFKLKPRKLSRMISLIPFLKDYFITSAYYLVGREHTNS